jgi:kumamolisin
MEVQATGGLLPQCDMLRRPAALALALAALIATLLTLAATPAARADAVAHATRVGSAPASEQLDLVLPLVVDKAGLRRFALAVTTIGSPEYGQYESIPRLAARFGASARTRARVVRFLRAAGATGVRVDGTGLFVDATLSAGRAQRLFATPLASFRIAHGARFTAPAGSVSLPHALRGLVTGVIGLSTQPVMRAPTLARAAAAGAGSGLARTAQASTQASSGYTCGATTPCLGTQTGCPGALASGGFTPNEYLTAYGYNSPPITNAQQGQGERVALIEIDGFNEPDVKAFASCFGLRLPKVTTWDANGDLGSQLPPGAESTLDLEILDGAAPRLSGIDVYESSAEASQALQALTAPLQNFGYKPNVISASIGDCEQNDSASVGNEFVDASEAALEEAAASGITFVASAGDAGSAACTSKGTPVGHLAVSYPASSQWATAVGGTNITLNAQNQITSEVVWNDASAEPGAAGAGGFSDVFPTPSYQEGIPSAVAFAHRAVPDVSMLADILPGYAFYCTDSECATPAQPNGGWLTVGGTSAGTPLLAGGFVLVDRLLRAAGRQDLGFVNPLLYNIGSNPTLAGQVFYDVTQGSNDVGAFVPNIGAPLGCCTAGPGYDEASGWGSVNLAAFANEALTVSPAIVQLSVKLPGGQRPVHTKHVVASISCSGSCLVGAFASVKVGRRVAFTAYSNPYTLKQAGTVQVPIGFSKAEAKALSSALAHHSVVVASVRGAIIDAAGNIERESPALKLTIRS